MQAPEISIAAAQPHLQKKMTKRHSSLRVTAEYGSQAYGIQPAKNNQPNATEYGPQAYGNQAASQTINHVHTLEARNQGGMVSIYIYIHFLGRFHTKR
jgi:hypothetical protein